MKRIAIFSFFLFFTISLASTAHCQVTSMSRRCSGPSPTPGRSTVEVQKNGDVNIEPCPTRQLLFRGSPISITGLSSLNGLSGATQTFGTGAADTFAIVSSGTAHTFNLPITAVSGASRTNFFPYFNAANTFAKSPFSWNGTQFEFQNSTFDNAFLFQFKPNGTGLTNGSFIVGRALRARLTVDDTSEVIQAFGHSQIDLQAGVGPISEFTISTLGINADSNAGTFKAGDVNTAANGTLFTVNDVSKTFSLATTTGTGIFSLAGVQSFTLNRTMTPAGTTGGQTINKPAGTVNLVAGAGSILVTNSTVTGNSIVLAVARVVDSTCSVKSVTPATGSFIITMTAACTAETSVGFIVTN
jgi:hypothetical protein